MIDNKIFLDLEKDKIVVFLDVLGFSDKICEAAKYQDEIKASVDKKTPMSCICNLSNIYDTVVNVDNSNEVQENKDFKFMWVSDSIVLISKYENIGLVLDRVASMSRLFLTFDMLIRGGISCGDIHYRDNVVGVPYIDAVKLEKKAKYPRVLISKENYEIIKPYLKNSEYNFMHDFFKKTEFNEYWEFDFIEYNILGGLTKKFNMETLEYYVSVFKNEMDLLCNHDEKNTRILEKYVWLGKKLIDIIEIHSNKIDNPERMIEDIQKYKIIDVL